MATFWSSRPTALRVAALRVVALRVTALLCAAALAAPLRANTPSATHTTDVVVQRLVPNDQRRPAGQIVNGERRIELDIVRATWRRDALKPARDTTMAFAERGQSPQNPGPLLRRQAGMLVHVSVHNTLDKAVQLRGLGDRVRSDTTVNGCS